MEEQLFKQKLNKIKKVITQSYESSYYSNLYRNLDFDFINQLTYDNFKKIPVLTKDIYNRNKFYMLTKKDLNLDNYYNFNDYNAKREYLNTNGYLLKVTSGSTGIPLEVIKSYSDNRNDYITLNLYRHKISNYDFKGLFLWIWPVNPLIRKLFYANDVSDNYININNNGYQYMLYDHSEINFELLYQFILKNNFEWITSSPSVLASFSDFLLDNNYIVSDIQYIECHSEYLYEWQIEKIKNAFNVYPTSIYSSNEIQFIGGLCSKEKLHLFSNCFVEFLDNEVGNKEICITSLNYFDIPIIRYKLGDCGDWDKDQDCNCEFINHPKFKLKQYRTNDYIVSKYGQHLEPFIITDSIVYISNFLGLKLTKYRVIQKWYDNFEYCFSKELIIDTDKINYHLEKYLSELLKYKVYIIVTFKDFNTLTYHGNKYKYFEVDKILLENHSNNHKNTQV